MSEDGTESSSHDFDGNFMTSSLISVLLEHRGESTNIVARTDLLGH